jgi:hypothetical protein
MPRRAGSCVGPVGQQTAVDGLAADGAEREAVSGRHAMSEARLEKVKVSGSTTGVHLAKGRPGGEPSDLWDELPELLRFRSSSDCTFGCILLRIKFCIPLITFCMYPHWQFVTSSVSSESHPASGRRGWSLSSEQTEQNI